MPQKKKKPEPDYEIEAYGAFDGSMNLLYATIKPDKKACEEALHRFNPPVPGYSYPYKVLPLVVGVFQSHQSTLQFEEN